MKTKGGVAALCWLMMLSAVFMGCISTEAADNVLGITDVVYGVNNSYEILVHNVKWSHTFFFGLGTAGYPVQTDTPLTLGALGDATQVYGCFDGKMERTPLSPDAILQYAIVQVRFNSTDSHYRLQITHDSTDVYIQFDNVSGILSCSSGVAGTPIRFASPSSFSRDHLHKPATAVLHQVVDA